LIRKVFVVKKEYKVVLYKEGGLSSLIFGAAKIDPIKFTDFLNSNGAEGWRVVTMEKDLQRLMLLFRREAYTVIMERDIT